MMNLVLNCWKWNNPQRITARDMLQNGYSPSDLIYTLTPDKIEKIDLLYELEHENVDLHMSCVDWHPIADEDNMNKHEYIIVYIWNKMKDLKIQLKENEEKC